LATGITSDAVGCELILTGAPGNRLDYPLRVTALWLTLLLYTFEGKINGH